MSSRINTTSALARRRAQSAVQRMHRPPETLANRKWVEQAVEGLNETAQVESLSRLTRHVGFPQANSGRRILQVASTGLANYPPYLIEAPLTQAKPLSSKQPSLSWLSGPSFFEKRDTRRK